MPSRLPPTAVRSAAALALALSFSVHADAQQPTLALSGGRVLDGFGGLALENGVVLVAGERIVEVGPASEVAIPAGVPVIDTNGMTVMPGLCDMHVHLQLLGHGDYRRWHELFSADQERIMAIAARQLLEAGVTCARDLGGPLEELVATRRRIASGEIPGPRLFISGPFLQRAPYEDYEERYRWGVSGAADAAAKTRRLLDAGVDVIKLIDQDQLTDEEVEAIVGTAHAAGKPVVAHAHRVVAHAHRMEEIRVGLRHGVDNFEHTGLGTAPGYAPDVLQGLRERNASLWWTPTISPLYVMHHTGEVFPERLDDPSWHVGMEPDLSREIRASLEHIPRLPYYALCSGRRACACSSGRIRASRPCSTPTPPGGRW
jgi:cytosine/adenosine deaminase-related metal-dependent hydrolase